MPQSIFTILPPNRSGLTFQFACYRTQSKKTGISTIGVVNQNINYLDLATKPKEDLLTLGSEELIR